MTLIRALLCLSLLWSPAFSEETTTATSLNAKQQNQAYRWLCATDSDTRRRAHQFLGQLSDNERPLHEAILKKARKHHASKLETALERAYQALQPLAATHRDWSYHCQQALDLGRKDLKRDSSDFKKLDQLLKKASRSYGLLQKQAHASSQGSKALAPIGKIILELEMELALLRGDEEDAFGLSLDDVYEDIPFGDSVNDLVDQVEKVLTQRQTFEQIDTYNNKASKWPTSPQRKFAKIINEMRGELGLSPLYLQKELTQGSINHSAEMARLGYFAHESPTPANASPSKRAKNAKYTGRWQGENIFRGSSSPMAAYVAWWKSDGHRKLMLSNGPNHLGIGLSQSHWTLSLGKGRTPKAE